MSSRIVSLQNNVGAGIDKHTRVTAVFAIAVTLDTVFPQFAGFVGLMVNLLWLWED